MTSRERVFATLDNDLAGRVPRDLWSLPWAGTNHPEMIKSLAKDFPNDIVSPPVRHLEEIRSTGDAYSIGEFTDEWGCVFENLQAGVIGEVKQPLIQTWDDLESLRTPTELLSLDTEAIDRFCDETEQFVQMGSCARPFERLQFLRTTEQLYVDLGLLAAGEPSAEFKSLIATVHEFYCDELDAWSKTRVDALFFMDDWGSQQSLLIHPQVWRDVFKPLYREYVQIAHRAGKRVFMHSDGYILDIIPDLIELGVDAINSQIFCMSVEQLERFRGEICFWGEIDRQHLLPGATTDEIASAVEDVKDYLFENGGIIAQCEFGPGAKPENVYEVFASWDRITG